MSNQWTLKNQTASDDTHKAIYHGTVAKEIWYKGQKIWDNAPDFWSFARPSRIGIAEWGDNPWRYPGLWALYRNAHANEYVGTNLFYPTSAALGIPLFDSEFGYDAKWAAWEQEDPRNHFYPPYIAHGSDWFNVTSWSFVDGKLTMAISRTQDVAERLVYSGPFGWETFTTYCYQTGYPFDTARFSDFSVPPGDYRILVDGVSSSVHRTEQFYHYGSSVRRYYAVTINGVRESIDDSLSYLGGSDSQSTYSKKLDTPADISVDSEIGGSRGDAGGTWSNSLKVYANRTAIYMSGLRPGQLRGIFSTEPRGRGTRYAYAVNDKRGVFAGFPGYYNIDPTECIDPETGVMVQKPMLSCLVDRYTSAGSGNKRIGYYVMGDRLDTPYITVSFYEKNVVIKKGNHTMILYYYKGSNDYGHNWS